MQTVSRGSPQDHLLIWVLAGGIQATVDGKPIEGTPGQLMWFPPGIPHSYVAPSTGSWEWLWVHFSGSGADAVMQEMALFGSNNVIDLKISPFIRSTFLWLIATANQDDVHGGQTALRGVDARLVGLFGLLLERLRESPHMATPSSSQLLDLFSWIAENLASEITLSTLSRQSGYSPAQLSRLVRLETGFSPIAYLTKTRMSQAAWLLAETRMSVQEVARAVGYSDAYHFSRRFSQLHGFSPRTYRERHESLDRLPVLPPAVDPGN